MVWKIELTEPAKKQLKKLDKPVAKKIIQFLKERLALAENPRSLGKALKGSQLGTFWRYRVGDCRIITHIDEEVCRVLVVKIGHRKEVYL